MSPVSAHDSSKVASGSWRESVRNGFMQRLPLTRPLARRSGRGNAETTPRCGTAVKTST
jgi:hypothetical protein